MSRRSPTDTARGGARRAAILDATIRVIAGAGAGGLTHRAVAAEAGVPLAAMTYYFASRDDLMTQAFRHLADRELAELAEETATTAHTDSPDLLAAIWANVLASKLRHDPYVVRAGLELHLASARTSAMRPIHVSVVEANLRYLARQLAAVGSADPETDAGVLLHLMVGLQLGALAEPDPHRLEERLATSLRGVLRGLLATHQPPASTRPSTDKTAVDRRGRVPTRRRRSRRARPR